MTKPSILWVDDEIDLLKPYIIFLAGKGYDVTTVNNGTDALEAVRGRQFDILFLDENMPGISGLETLTEISRLRPTMPVVMITQNEEENIMDMAIGKQIADYLLKPVNPSQILMTLKRNLHRRDILNAQTIARFHSEFRDISMAIGSQRTADDWYALHRRLTDWDLLLDEADDQLHQMLHSLIDEADQAFQRYVRANYLDWIENKEGKEGTERPLLSPDVMRRTIFPMLDRGDHVLFIVIDNLRYDQWCVLRELLADENDIVDDSLYLSILPTATQYARNAIFAGLMPLQISKMYPQYWTDEDEEEGKNRFERELMETQIARFRRKNTITYHKFGNVSGCDQATREITRDRADLAIVVTNFVDMLSHASTDNKMIKELSHTEAAFRALTRDWFKHSHIIDMIRQMGRLGYRTVITTDHGATLVSRPLQVVGDRKTTVALRYKVGKSLNFNSRDARDIFEIKQPARAGLPAPNLSSSYIFATGKSFLAYPNNYNYYVQYYKDTFQHGGISMDEMIIPLATIEPKKI